MRIWHLLAFYLSMFVIAGIVQGTLLLQLVHPNPAVQSPHISVHFLLIQKHVLEARRVLHALGTRVRLEPDAFQVLLEGRHTLTFRESCRATWGLRFCKKTNGTLYLNQDYLSYLSLDPPLRSRNWRKCSMGPVCITASRNVSAARFWSLDHESSSPVLDL